MDGQLGQVPEWVRAARGAGGRRRARHRRPLCHGIGSFLIGKLGADAIDVLPAVSTLQLAFARLKHSWQARRSSRCTAPTAANGPGARPATASTPRPRRRRARADRRVHQPANSPDRIARALIAAGHGDDFRLSVAARLGLPDERVAADLPLADAAAPLPDPNIVVLKRVTPPEPRAIFGFDDADFVQRAPEKGLITKQEARALSLAKLRLRPDSLVWDIGAGSGSVGLEAARLARHGHVWAIEKNAGDAANARDNARRLRASNYTLCEGRAPTASTPGPTPTPCSSAAPAASWPG
jgi:precorrin-6Y C5,15-methyltransferase (decarboxylating)